jgi:hypothetical protein
MNFNYSSFLLIILLLVISTIPFNVYAQENNNTSDEGPQSLENEQDLPIEDEAISTTGNNIDQPTDEQDQQQPLLLLPQQTQEEQDNITASPSPEIEVQTESMQDEITTVEILRPVADAGPDITMNAGEEIKLDGTGSYARNGTLVSYHWQVEEWDDVEENIPTLQDSDSATPTLIAPHPTRTPSSSYGIELQVTDSNGLSDSDFVVVRVITPYDGPLIPQANAGGDQTVEEGQQVVLFGTNSYARNGTIVEYEWSWKDWPTELQEENLPQLHDSDTHRTYFTAPNVTSGSEDKYVIELKVTDNNGLFDIDDAVITVLSTDFPILLDPVADAGQDQTVDEGDRVILDGSGSFARNGTLVEHNWSLNDWADEEENLPQLHDTDKPLAWFVAPHPTAGPSSQYNFELRVFDSNGLADSDDVRVNVLAENVTNTRPIAIAEISDDDVCEGRTVTLDASRSHDHDDGDEIISYNWEITKGDGNDDFPEIANTNAKITTINTNNILQSNSATFEIELTVQDNRGGVDKDQIALHVEKCPYRGDDGNERDEEEQTAVTVTEQPSQTLTTTLLNSMIQQSLFPSHIQIIQASPNCDPLSNSTAVTGQMLSNELRMLAYFGNCQIANGTLTLNIQVDPEDMKLLAGHIDNTTTSDVIEINMTDNNILGEVNISGQGQQQQQIQQQQPIANSTTYRIPLNNTMTGTDLETQMQRTVNGVNALALWNANPDQAVILDANNTANVTATFIR